MISRRDLMISGACAAAAGASAALQVRRDVTLLKGARVAEIVPAKFGGWISQDMGDPYAVNGEKTLANKLYNELVVREYVSRDVASPITMLLAYGGRQTDELQLHRPEICYPAFGFSVLRNDTIEVPLGGGVAVPARRLSARNDDHRENIIYWSRMGEKLPQDGREQKIARLEIAMSGIIPDGLLARFSMAGDFPDQDWRALGGFIRDLVGAIAPERRKVLIGTARADGMRPAPAST